MTAKDQRVNQKIKDFIPLNSYYTPQLNNPQGKGELFKLIGNENNKKLSFLERDFSAFFDSLGYWGFIHVHRYVRIYFEDIFNNQHVQYYNVLLIYGASRLENNLGERVFHDYNESYKKVFILSLKVLKRLIFMI